MCNTFVLLYTEIKRRNNKVVSLEHVSIMQDRQRVKPYLCICEMLNPKSIVLTTEMANGALSWKPSSHDHDTTSDQNLICNISKK